MSDGTKRDNEEQKQLQEQIIAMQHRLGWTQARLAEVIYCELNEETAVEDEDAGIRRFTEALKKQLKRPTTSAETLQRYIDIISNHQDFRKANLVVANPIRLGAVDIQTLRGVSEISRKFIKEQY